MADWKKIIVSGSIADLAGISLSDLQGQPTEGTVLTINPSGVVGTKEGASGTSGSSGSSGTSGTSGSDGSSGSSGTSGVDGAVGSSGTSGTNGSSGTSGSNGSSGSSGTSGDDGAAGSSGSSGTSGSSGSSGTSGSSGADGSSGTSGTSGSDGSSGSSGTSGTDGTSGSSGSSGTSGTSGSDGSSGSSGTSGTAGTDGTSGSSGSSGTSGSSGSSGDTGTSGSSGSSGTSGVINVTNSGNNRVLTDIDGESANAESQMTFITDGGTDVGGLLSVTGDVVISHNLTVQGTASFQNSENLLVADRFILMASGSTSAGDGGIVVQQDTQDYGEAFAFDGLSTERWGVTGSFHASGSGFTPDAFMSTVVVGVAGALPASAASRYQQSGNIFTSASGDVYIYS